MNLYAESSAVLSWLLGEADGDAVRESLAAAEIILASELTLIECHRVLQRAAATGRITEAWAADLQARLAGAAGHWMLLGLGPEVVSRARRPFPAEPIRTLDALHLSSALVARTVVPEIALLSLDRRVRRSGRQLGFRLLPS